LRNPMICSSEYLLFLISAILLVGGLLLLHRGTAGGEQVMQADIQGAVHQLGILEAG
jgi:hypothetical protein